MLDNASLYTANLRGARSTDVYTCKGGGEEIWEPRFTFHGFRYVELGGVPGEVALDTITGIVLHSPMPTSGEFECSDPLINQLQQNIQWGQRGNFLEVPTDCPQRDERLGWLGDAQVFARTAAFNFDVESFFTKWQTDLADAQLPSGEFPSVAPNVFGLVEGGPSWLYAVTQGATTIWERWDGGTPGKGFQSAGMNSFNHYAYGAIGEWLYSTVAGLDMDPARSAYKHTLVKPRPGGELTRAHASLLTPYGKLSSSWKIEGQTFQREVEVPPNTTATIYVPAGQGEPAAEAPGVVAEGWADGAAVYRVGSGAYKFIV